MIAFLCSHCGAQLRVRKELAGTAGKCPRCGQMIEAPAGSDSGPRRTGRATPAPPPGGRDTPGPPAASRPVFEGQATVKDGDLAFLAPARGPGEIGRLGNYRVLGVLGAGGMGIVLLAEDVGLQRQVALKAMKPAMAASADYRQRFLREARTAAAIEHDHIVTIYQVGEDRGVPFLAMKLLRGESLEERLNRVKRLGVAEVLRVGQEIAEGLAAAHERGLIHRDIKPANVWLEEGTDRVKIVDFGLARGGDEDARLTQEGWMVGTPAYMSPEQADCEPLDHRSDLFSLGCVLFRASTGELPFRGKSTLAVLNALATTTPPPPVQLNPELPEAFSDLVVRLLKKDRERRPDSAREVADALRDLREHVELAARLEGAEVVTDEEEGPPERALEEVPEEPLEEVAEAEPEPEVVEEAAPAPGKRRGKRKRKRAGGKERPEDYWERKVMALAIVAGIIVFLIIAFLIVRHHFFKRKEVDNPTSAARPHYALLVRSEEGLNHRVTEGTETDTERQRS
jgi:hypothetical protein